MSMQPATNTTDIESAEIRSQLQRILRSSTFERAGRSQSLLTYLVESAIATPPVPVKEYSIAIDVFGRAATYDPNVDSTVRVEAGRLRGRLREYYTAEGRDDEVTLAIPKGGYTVAFSRRVAAAPSHGRVHPEEASAPAPEPAQPQAALPSAFRLSNWNGRVFRPTSRSRVFTVVACVAGLLVGLSALHERALNAASSIQSMAVLPLRNLSGSSDRNYLAEGMTDELNTELARVPHLRVISRDSVLHEDLEKKSLPQVAKDLDVDAVVEGSIVCMGSKIRINAQLTDVRSNRQLWAASVDGDVDNLIAMEGNLAQEIAAHARLVLSPGPQGHGIAADKPSPEAYDAYLRARYFLDKRDATRSIQYFQRAIDLDPTFASAYAGLAEALEAAFTLGSAQGGDSRSRALASAHKAIELDPQNGPAYSALGTIEFTQLWDWNRAEQDFLKGIQLSPDDSFPVTMYGLFLDSRDRREEALAQMRRAATMDPLSFYVSRNLGASLYFARKYDEALLQLDRAKELQPERSELVDNWISWTYEAEGMRDQAVQYDLASLRPHRAAEDIEILQRAYRSGGWKAYWRSRLQAENNQSEAACAPYQRAIDWLHLEDSNRAVSALQQASDRRCYWMELIAVDPRFDPLHSDPRFASIVRQINTGLTESD
jgi:TolB-like protein/Tfp pilus assembly protein PilF